MSFSIDDNLWGLIGEFNREQGDPETSLARANMHKDNGNFKQAVLDYNHYLKHFQDKTLPYLFLADCYYFLNNNELAISHYEIGISKISGKVPLDFLNNYGGALMEEGQYEKALTVVDNLLAQNKKHTLGNILKGQLLLQLDQFDRAFYYLTKAIELDKKMWQAWATRLKVDYALGDYTRADYDFKNAHIIYSDLPAHYYTTHAFALYKMGKTDDAIAQFDKAKILGDPEAKRVLEKLTTK